MFKKILSFFVLLTFIIIGFTHNSMMAFAMNEKGMNSEMMKDMDMSCCNFKNESKGCDKSCCFSSLDNNEKFIVNNNFQKKIIKIKLFNFLNVLSFSSNFLDNKNLIKNTSPPNLVKEIKFYSYTDLVKIIKSNT